MGYFDEDYLQQRKKAALNDMNQKPQELDYQSLQAAPVQPVESVQSAPPAQGANVANAAMTGAAAGGPAGAAIGAGGSLLTQYLAERAAAEREKRAREVQIAQQHTQDEDRGYDTLF